ncbi:MAG: UvrD-helicase domain-containing protein, partial [Elusimicrobiota bacterium]|nr:UvrD-helicase domain-containing protein [Elusimicrobiota bacterium]
MTKDQAQIISVSASAGSGKTYNLAKRYIELIFADNQIKNIVAITFANKAALEMKSRVIEYLKKAALNVDTQKIFDSLDDKQNKSIMLLEKILNDYDDFNISTIDSFKNNLLKACAFNLNLSPEFTIENKYDEYLRFAVEAFVRKANKNAEAKKLLLDYLDQYTLFEKNSWFPKEDIFRETKGVFSKSSNYGKDIKITKEQGKDEPFSSASSFNLEFRKLSDSLHDLSLSLLDRIKELNLKVGDRFMKSLEKFIAETNKACHSFVFSAYFLKPELKGADGDDKIISLWASISEEIEALIDFNMSHYYSVYLRLYSFIIREFNLQTKKNELILLAEINRKTLLLFDTDKVQVPEVYYRLSERYKHFLLDEFQDTNSAQWIGIRRFLEESIPNGGSLFYVGDVKQAIYDFRGGDPRIFLNIKNEFSQYKYEERVLIENYRSHKAIVDFNNFVFSKSN